MRLTAVFLGLTALACSSCASQAVTAPADVADSRLVFPLNASAQPLCDATPLMPLALPGQVATQALIDQAIHASNAAHAQILRADYRGGETGANPGRLTIRVDGDNRIIETRCG